MATFAIESNGRLEKTAVYYNGQQLGGVKEVFLNLDEEGTFDAIIQYEGTDKEIHTKQIFVDYFDNVRLVEPSFTEEEARNLHIIEVESSGSIDDAVVFYDKEELDGIICLFIHIKGSNAKNGIRSLFSFKKNIPEQVEFRADITFRNDDGSVDDENVF
jgi:hypothetical protein